MAAHADFYPLPTPQDVQTAAQHEQAQRAAAAATAGAGVALTGVGAVAGDFLDTLQQGSAEILAAEGGRIFTVPTPLETTMQVLTHLPDFGAVTTASSLFALALLTRRVINHAQFADKPAAVSQAAFSPENFTVPDPDMFARQRLHGDRATKVGGGILALAGGIIAWRSSIETSIVTQGIAFAGALGVLAWSKLTGPRAGNRRPVQRPTKAAGPQGC